MLLINWPSPFSGYRPLNLSKAFEFLLTSFRYSGSDDLSSRSPGGYLDPRFKRVLWYMIGSTKGGANRAKMLKLLNERPSNPNQIATSLKLDYKTVLHHLKVLSENGLVISDNKDSYGATYFLTPLMEKNYETFKGILEKIEGS